MDKQKFELEVRQKLGTVNETQAQIQTISSYLVFHKRRADSIAAIWKVYLTEQAEPQQQLALLYLINDVLQNSRKKGREFIDAFSLLIVDTFTLLSEKWSERGLSEKVKPLVPRVQRLLNVWDERQVFSKQLIDACRAQLQPLVISSLVQAQPVKQEALPIGDIGKSQEKLLKLHQEHQKLYNIKEELLNAQMRLLKRDHLAQVIEARKQVVQLLNAVVQNHKVQLSQEQALLQRLDGAFKSSNVQSSKEQPQAVKRPQEVVAVQENKKLRVELQLDEEYDPFEGYIDTDAT